MSFPKLKLYYFEACPFCQMVLHAIKRLNVKVEYCDIYENHEHLEKLKSDTNRKTTPCLYIDEKPMHESKDIMDWLETNIDRLEKN